MTSSRVQCGALLVALKINESYVMWNHSGISSSLTGGKGTKETEGNGMGWAGLGKKKRKKEHLHVGCDESHLHLEIVTKVF